jgi:hypothetical protein
MNSSGGLWDEPVHSSVEGCNHGSSDLAAKVCDVIAMSSLHFANEVVRTQ